MSSILLRTSRRRPVSTTSSTSKTPVVAVGAMINALCRVPALTNHCQLRELVTCVGRSFSTVACTASSSSGSSSGSSSNSSSNNFMSFLSRHSQRHSSSSSSSSTTERHAETARTHAETARTAAAILLPADEDTLIKQFFLLAKKNDDSGVEELVESSTFQLVRDAINNTDQFGNSPIMIAAQRNWNDVIFALQKNEFCDINHQNFFGSSALMCSASHGHLDALRVLCGNQLTQINLLSRFGQTALMKAAQAGKLDSIRILLDFGADPGFVNKQGKGAIEIAEEKGHAHVASFLRLQLKPTSSQ